MKNFFIKATDDKKSIKMSEDKHTATISLFGLKLLIGFSDEDKKFSFGFNKTKLVSKTKKVFNAFVSYFQKNKNVNVDEKTVIRELMEEVQEVISPDVDDEELTVKDGNYIGTIKLFGLGIVISYNKKFKNFINFKKEKMGEAFNSVRKQVRN